MHEQLSDQPHALLPTLPGGCSICSKVVLAILFSLCLEHYWNILRFYVPGGTELSTARQNYYAEKAYTCSALKHFTAGPFMARPGPRVDHSFCLYLPTAGKLNCPQQPLLPCLSTAHPPLTQTEI